MSEVKLTLLLKFYIFIKVFEVNLKLRLNSLLASNVAKPKVKELTVNLNSCGSYDLI